MYCDVVLPEGNEKEFIKTARKLGYTAICFLYPLDKFQIEGGVEKAGLDVYFGIIAREGEVKKARKKSDLVMVEEPKDVRQCVEKESPDVIFNVESHSRKDFIHQRNSGLDHIISRSMLKKKVCFGFSLQNMVEQKEKETFLGRTMQNILLVAKYNTGSVIASFAKSPYFMRNPEDLVSLFSSLGMNKREAKFSLQNIPKIFEENKKRRKGLLKEGIEIVEE